DLNRRSVRINGRTISRIAGVVPHTRSVRVGCDCVHVIAEEFRDQAVRARPARVTDYAAVQRRESTRHTAGDVRVPHHTDQASEAGRVIPERRGEGVVNDIEVTSVRRNSRRRVEAAVTEAKFATAKYATPWLSVRIVHPVR